MDSGFNHINLTIGDDLNLGEPYNITEQITKDIFNNNKMLYCRFSFPEAFRQVFGFTNLVCPMLRIGDKTYLASAITPFQSQFLVFSLNIVRNLDNVYLDISYKVI